MLVEVCIGSAEDALVAQQAGADRVELCSALMLGGLTPSAGTIHEVVATVSIPVMVMIRPRGGGFCYSDADFRVMVRDAEQAVAMGADGIVFGVLTESGEIDQDRNARLCEVGRDVQTVFHRAFDVIPDPRRGLEELIQLQCTRVLTSGQEANVYNGAGLIRELITQADGRIEILPGGGINRFNLPDILSRTGCRQLHIGATGTRADSSVHARAHVHFGGSLQPPEDRYTVTDAQRATALIQQARTA